MAFQQIKISCCRASQRFNSLSIDVNVKNRWSQSRNTKDFEDCCQRPVCGAEMGVPFTTKGIIVLPAGKDRRHISRRSSGLLLQTRLIELSQLDLSIGIKIFQKKGSKNIQGICS
jgi:hypothetical protein